MFDDDEEKESYRVMDCDRGAAKSFVDLCLTALSAVR